MVTQNAPTLLILSIAGLLCLLDCSTSRAKAFGKTSRNLSLLSSYNAWKFIKTSSRRQNASLGTKLNRENTLDSRHNSRDDQMPHFPAKS